MAVSGGIWLESFFRYDTLRHSFCHYIFTLRALFEKGDVLGLAPFILYVILGVSFSQFSVE